jgi:hypothetical protein
MKNKNLIFYVDNININLSDNGIVFDFLVSTLKGKFEPVVRIGCSYEFAKFLLKELNKALLK